MVSTKLSVKKNNVEIMVKNTGKGITPKIEK